MKNVNAIPLKINSIPKVLNNNIKIFENTKKEGIIKNNLHVNQKPLPRTNDINNNNYRVNNNPIKQESVEFTLPTVPIDKSHRIEYYYPYFYKTRVIDYYDNLNYKDLINECSDLGCEWCEASNNSICRQCRHGYFAYNTQCFTVCPNKYVADIFKRTCNSHDITSINN
jgi:hypothetical protein